MEWENKVIVVDDILPKKLQEDLKRILFGNQFPWHFIFDVTGGASKDGRPAFHNKLIDDGKVNVGGEPLNLFQQLINNSLARLY